MKIQLSLRKNTDTNKRKNCREKKKKLKKNDIKIDNIYFLQMDKLSLSDIKELVQGHRANKVKDTGFKFSHLGYSQYGPNH